MAERRGVNLDKAVPLVVTLDPVRIFALLYRKFVPKRESHLEECLKCPC
jgi:hypothetical protein